jgi:hypothetical protein
MMHHHRFGKAAKIADPVDWLAVAAYGLDYIVARTARPLVAAVAVAGLTLAAYAAKCGDAGYQAQLRLEPGDRHQPHPHAVKHMPPISEPCFLE